MDFLTTSEAPLQTLSKKSLILPCSENQPAVYLCFIIKNVCHIYWY